MCGICLFPGQYALLTFVKGCLILRIGLFASPIKRAFFLGMQTCSEEVEPLITGVEVTLAGVHEAGESCMHCH